MRNCFFAGKVIVKVDGESSEATREKCWVDGRNSASHRSKLCRENRSLWRIAPICRRLRATSTSVHLDKRLPAGADRGTIDNPKREVVFAREQTHTRTPRRKHAEGRWQQPADDQRLLEANDAKSDRSLKTKQNVRVQSQSHSSCSERAKGENPTSLGT